MPGRWRCIHHDFAAARRPGPIDLLVNNVGIQRTGAFASQPIDRLDRVPGAAVYTATKFGMASLSRAVRAELAGTRVTLSTTFPAAVATDLTAGLELRGVPKATPAEVVLAIVDSSRHGRPEIAIPAWAAAVGLVEQAAPGSAPSSE